MVSRRIDRAGDDADVADAFGDQADDLVLSRSSRSTLTLRMGGQEGAQRLGQEFGQRVGVGQHPHLAGEPARIGAEVLAQPLGLPENRARMLEQRAAGLRRRDPAAAAHQQRRAERLLHVADAGAGGGERQMRAFRAMRDAPRLDHMAEQTEIGEVETHADFVIREGCLWIIVIVRLFDQHDTS